MCQGSSSTYIFNARIPGQNLDLAERGSKAFDNFFYVNLDQGRADPEFAVGPPYRFDIQSDHHIFRI